MLIWLALDLVLTWVKLLSRFMAKVGIDQRGPGQWTCDRYHGWWSAVQHRDWYDNVYPDYAKVSTPCGECGAYQDRDDLSCEPDIIECSVLLTAGRADQSLMPKTYFRTAWGMVSRVLPRLTRVTSPYCMQDRHVSLRPQIDVAILVETFLNKVSLGHAPFANGLHLELHLQ
jgi:hypothetical protein